MARTDRISCYDTSDWICRSLEHRWSESGVGAAAIV